MKKYFIVELIVASIILVGCSNNPGVSLKGIGAAEEVPKATFTERLIYADSERPCFCIVNKEDIEKTLYFAAEKKDVDYLEDMLDNGKAFSVREKTKVRCSDKEVRRGIVLVQFLEGEHKGKWAYTFSKRVR